MFDFRISKYQTFFYNFGVFQNQVRRQLLAATGVQIGIDHHGTLGSLH